MNFDVDCDGLRARFAKLLNACTAHTAQALTATAFPWSFLWTALIPGMSTAQSPDTYLGLESS